MEKFIDNLYKNFESTFITGDRYLLFLRGLGTTINISIFAILLGIIIGIVVALLRLSRGSKIHNPVSRILFRIAIWIADVYVDIIRGTPAVVQLMIMYYVVLVRVDSKVVIAIIAFAINSGAYIAEIFRAGILAVDKGQMEASRSLGLNYFQSMYKIIIPQAIKNILPALANEFIVLIKETAIVGYVALQDLTKVGDFIISRTGMAIFPLISIAVIYFIIIKILTIFVAKLERRLRQSDTR